MTRLVRIAALSCVACVLVASAALANVPDPSKSTLPTTPLAVEGATTPASGLPDACSDGRCGDYTVTVKDFASNPVSGSSVVIDFANCSDIVTSCDQLNAATGQSYVNPKKVGGSTNAAGQFTFKAQGASTAVLVAGNVTSPGTNLGVACANIYADGVLLGSIKVVAYDVNGGGGGSNGVSGSDASITSAEANKIALGAQARQRNDINNSGSITGGDAAVYSQMANQAALGTGSQDTQPYCP